MSYVEDKRGVPRGSCVCGQCAQYAPQPEGHACGYCGCLPVKHEDLRKISDLQQSFPILGIKTELASDDELPVICGPSRPRIPRDLPDRLDAKDWTSEQATVRLSGTNKHIGWGSVKANKLPCHESLKQDSQIPGSFSSSQYPNSDALKKVPPCELLQTSHMPYYELPNKQPMRGVFKIAYKHKTIYIGKSLNIRRHLKRLMPGRIQQEIGNFLRNLSKKKKKYLTVSWIDSDVYEHNCKGKSYFRCITKIQGEKPKYSYPKKNTKAGGGGGGAPAVPAAIMSTPGVTGMITTTEQNSHGVNIDMEDVVSNERIDSPTQIQSFNIGVDNRQVKKKSESPQQPHSALTGESQERSKKSFSSGNLSKKKNDDICEGIEMAEGMKSDMHEIESEVGNLASLKVKCQTHYRKPKTSAADLLCKALHPKSTKCSTNAPETLATKEHATKMKSCSVLLNKRIYYIPETDVKKPPSEHLEETTSDTVESPWLERVKASSSLQTIRHVPSAEETTDARPSKVTVLKIKTEDLTTSTRYMDTTMSPAPFQGSDGVSGQENLLKHNRMNTSTAIPVFPTEEKNESDSICIDKKLDEEYSSPVIPFTGEENHEWVPDILADSEDSMKLIIDEQRCTYSPDTSKDTLENLPESPITPLKMEHDYRNKAFRSDSKSRPEEDDATVPAFPGNLEGSTESTSPISTQWVSMSSVQCQNPTEASATDSLRPQTVPMMSQFPNSFVENKGTFPSDYSDSSHSINNSTVVKGRSEGHMDGTTQSSSTDERISTGKLPMKSHAHGFVKTNSFIDADDTKPVKASFHNTTSYCTTKCPEGRVSRSDTRIVFCDKNSESCSPRPQYSKRRRESRPMFDNIEHWRSHQHLFKSYSYTRRELDSCRVEAHSGNVKDTTQ